LSAKTKELVALAISIVVHCEGCIAYYVHDAVEAGATRQELLETISVALLMGGGPARLCRIDYGYNRTIPARGKVNAKNIRVAKDFDYQLLIVISRVSVNIKRIIHHQCRILPTCGVA
jgi:AhpD family alkylhydroperoxidase